MKEPEVVRGATSASSSVQAGAKTTYSKDIVLWPYLLHSLPQCPNQVFLYHLIFFLFAAAQEADEAFSILARHVFYMQVNRDVVECISFSIFLGKRKKNTERYKI